VKLTRNKLQILSASSIFFGCLLGVDVQSASALTNTFTNLSAWQGQAGTTTLEDFNSSTTGNFSDPINQTGFNGFSIGGTLNYDPVNDVSTDTAGILAGTATGNTNGTNFVGWTGHGTGPTIKFNFNSPVNSFAFDWSDNDPTDFYRLDLYNGSNLVSSYGSPPFLNAVGTSSGFFGVVSDDTFTSASLVHDLSGTSTSATDFGVDNVRTGASVAVPFEFSPSLGLFLIGGVAGFSYLRKKVSSSVDLEA
jgi:hypothetical protein